MKIANHSFNKYTLFISVLITIVMYGFYSYVYIETYMIKLLNMGMTLCLLISAAPLLCSQVAYHNRYTQNMKCIIFITILSFISAYYFWGQSVLLSFRSSHGLLCFCIFFLLIKYKVPYGVIEKYILIMGGLYCIIWLLGFLTLPTPIVGGLSNDEVAIDESRGIVRMHIVGKSSLVLAYFFCLNKYSLSNNKKPFFLAIIFFAFILLQVTRQIILISFFVGVLYLLRGKNRTRNFIIAIFAILYFSGAITKLGNSDIIQNMSVLTEEQIRQNETEEYIRIQEYKFFFTNYTKNAVTALIGNGYPHSDSDFGKRYFNIQQSYAFYLSDVGYARMYTDMGIVGLALFSILFIKTSLKKCCDKFVFARLFMIYMLFANIAGSWYAQMDGVICICICAYLLGNNNREIITKK